MRNGSYLFCEVIQHDSQKNIIYAKTPSGREFMAKQAMGTWVEMETDDY